MIYREDISSFSNDLLRGIFSGEGPGAAAAILLGPQELLISSYGMRDISNARPMEVNTVLRLGSLSKQFTAVAILQLVERATLFLDTPVAAVLDLKPPRFQRIRIHHLLSHTSGLPPFLVQAREERLVHHRLGDRDLLKLIEAEPMIAQPGERWIYSDLGYVLLGFVVEAITGDTLANFSEVNMFKPLAMTRTSYRSHWQDSPSAAKGYEFHRNQYRRGECSIPRSPRADGAVNSTAEDIARWHRGLCAGKLISLSLLKVAESVSHLEDRTPVPYGFGWAVSEIRGIKIIEHGGNIAGFRSHFIKVPSIDLFVAIMANATDDRTPPSYLALQIASFALGKPLVQTAIAVPESLLLRCVGTYRTWSGVVRTLTLDSGRLFSQKTGGRKHELLPVGPGTFDFKGSLTRIEVSRGPAGMAQELTVFRRYGDPEVALRQTDKMDAGLLFATTRRSSSHSSLPGPDPLSGLRLKIRASPQETSVTISSRHGSPGSASKSAP